MNTKKNERLKFDSLEPYAGEWIHAEGRYTEKDGARVDVYDPTTGEIRSSSTADIACWLLDINYNGEIFVGHAYFTGGDEPYEKLKRALWAEIDEDAWSQLYSTTSRPFPKPETGKIAVKVINQGKSGIETGTQLVLLGCQF